MSATPQGRTVPRSRENALARGDLQHLQRLAVAHNAAEPRSHKELHEANARHMIERDARADAVSDRVASFPISKRYRKSIARPARHRRGRVRPESPIASMADQRRGTAAIGSRRLHHTARNGAPSRGSPFLPHHRRYAFRMASEQPRESPAPCEGYHYVARCACTRDLRGVPQLRRRSSVVAVARGLLDIDGSAPTRGRESTRMPRRTRHYFPTSGIL